MIAHEIPRLDLPALGRWLLFVAIAQAAGLIGALATSAGDGSWYAQLEKPAFNPPSWVFGPVWTALYILMGTAAFLVWERRGQVPGAIRALGIYGGQLILNLMWSLVFFGLESPLLGLIVIAALIVAIVATMIVFWPISRLASLLLVPYLGWVAFATVLNVAIWVLN
jgi:translocator protein